MENYICVTCGVQFDASAHPPTACPICNDERQYIGHQGQQWTTLDQLRSTHRNRIETVAPNLVGIGTEPSFAIGHRSLLVQTPAGNLLWDPTLLLSDSTIETVRSLGGIRWIAVSHPHLVTTCVEWSRAFHDAPIYWHARNREWVMRHDGNYVFWETEIQQLDADGRTVSVKTETKQLDADLTLILCGGHFAGSDVLHWANGAEGRGAVLAGDTIQVASDRRFVSFMYSYPNMIPLNAAKVTNILDSVEPFAFEQLYGGWWHSIIASDAKNAVKRSAARYLDAIAA